MVAKLVLGLVAIIIIVSLVTAVTFWYFNQESERAHQKDMAHLEHTERMVDIAESESSIEGQLEEERRR